MPIGMAWQSCLNSRLAYLARRLSPLYIGTLRNWYLQVVLGSVAFSMAKMLAVFANARSAKKAVGQATLEPTIKEGQDIISPGLFPVSVLKLSKRAQ